MTDDPRNLAPPLRDWRVWALVAGTSVVAAPVLVWAVATVRPPAFDGAAFGAVVALTIGLGLLPMVLAGGRTPGGADVTTAFVFAVLLHWGPAPALVVRAVALVCFALPHSWSWWRFAYNLAQYTVSWTAAAVVLAIAGLDPGTRPVPLTGAELLPVVAAGAVYLVVNTLAVTAMIAAHRHQRLVAVLVREVPQKLVVNGALLALAPLVVLAAERSPWLVLLAPVPLLAVREVGALSARQEYAAQHDALTGLPNRQLFVARSREALAEVAAGQRSAAVLLLDLDRFKDVNDAFGHPAGDELLQQVADRLVAAAGPGATVARLSGDEFAVLEPWLPPSGAVRAAEAAARRLSAALILPVPLRGIPVGVTASIGIAVCPDHGDDPDDLLARADAAMYVAKGGGPAMAYALCRPERDRGSAERLALLGELRRAVAGDPDAGALVLRYQPQVALAGGALVGAEALLRWDHPTRGLLRPGEFLPVVGHGSLLPDLTRHVLELALAQRRRWADDGLMLPLAVNVTAEDLPDETFAGWLAGRLEAHGVDAKGLTLEITETALMVDATRVLPTLRALDALGVAISLDDFGTGFASLTHLRMLPVRELKIDRSFVAGLRTEPDDEALARSILELGGALGLRVVAEGVEDQATEAALLALGGTEAQGNHFCPPLPADELTAWAAARRN